MLLGRIEKGLFHTLYNDLCVDEKKYFNYFRRSKPSFEELLHFIYQIFSVDLLLHHFHNITYRRRPMVFHCSTNLTVYFFQFPKSEVTLSSDGVRIIVGNSKMRMVRNARTASAKNCDIYECPKDTANIGVISVKICGFFRLRRRSVLFGCATQI